MGGSEPPRLGDSVVDQGSPLTTLCTEGCQLFSPSNHVIEGQGAGPAGKSCAD